MGYALVKLSHDPKRLTDLVAGGVRLKMINAGVINAKTDLHQERD